MTKTFQIDFPKQLEHPLFRAAQQLIVGVRQGHSKEAINRYANTLELLANQLIPVSQDSGKRHD